MNQASQERKIRAFLDGKLGKEVDAFRIYQWIDRCHFHGWWVLGCAMGSFIPPNSLNQDYRKRLEYLLNECRKGMEAVVEIENLKTGKICSIPEFFYRTCTDLGLTLIPKSERSVRILSGEKEGLFLRDVDSTGCVVCLYDPDTDDHLDSSDNKGFQHRSDFLFDFGTLTWRGAERLMLILRKKRLSKQNDRVKARRRKSPEKWNRFGHRLSAMSAKIDEFLLKGTTLDAAAEKLGTTVSRIERHINDLMRDKRIAGWAKGSDGVHLMLFPAKESREID